MDPVLLVFILVFVNFLPTGGFNVFTVFVFVDDRELFNGRSRVHTTKSGIPERDGRKPKEEAESVLKTLLSLPFLMRKIQNLQFKLMEQ